MPREKFIHPALNHWTENQGHDDLSTSTAVNVRGRKDRRTALDAEQQLELQKQMTQDQSAQTPSRTSSGSAYNRPTHLTTHKDSNNQAAHLDRPELQFPHSPHPARLSYFSHLDTEATAHTDGGSHLATETTAHTDGGPHLADASASSAQSEDATAARPKVTHRAPNANTAGSKRKVEYNMNLTPPRKVAKGRFLTATDAFAQNKAQRAEPTARPNPVPKAPQESELKVPSEPQAARRINQAPTALAPPAPKKSMQVQPAKHNRGPKAKVIQLDMPGDPNSGPAFLARVFGEEQARQQDQDRQVDTSQQQGTCYFWLCYTLGWRGSSCRKAIDSCAYAHKFTGLVRDVFAQPPRDVRAASLEDLSPKQFMYPKYNPDKRGRGCQSRKCCFAHGDDLVP